MKRLINSQLLLLALIIAGVLAAGACKAASDKNRTGMVTDNYERVKKEFEVKPGGEIILKMKTGGDIRIKGWDKNVVSIIADVSNKADLFMEQNGNTVELRSAAKSKNAHNADVDLVIKVPYKFSIDFDSMGGDIKLENIEGTLKGITMGGELELYSLKGKLNAQTMGGDITIKDSQVDGVVITMGGDVLVEDVEGDFNATSMGGTVEQKNVTKTGTKKGSYTTGKETNISSMGGDLTIDDAPFGAKLNTMGGDITVNFAGKYLQAETKGGDIIAKSVEGWVKATTFGGDIEIKMTGDPNSGKRDATLTSYGGDVTLIVPRGMSMNIDVEIAYTKNNRSHDFNYYKVISNFNLKEDRTDEWDDSEGQPRKYIYTKGNINGGKNYIKIKTINGRVFIKES